MADVKPCYSATAVAPATTAPLTASTIVQAPEERLKPKQKSKLEPIRKREEDHKPDYEPKQTPKKWNDKKLLLGGCSAMRVKTPKLVILLKIVLVSVYSLILSSLLVVAIIVGCIEVGVGVAALTFGLQLVLFILFLELFLACRRIAKDNLDLFLYDPDAPLTPTYLTSAHDAATS
ncbi:hypothetical protein BYT27DRAFT_7213288 [Phlegmacium glaucopus]|nr:hypothetical protein BYT27DRAFT_7213288 [Phlegmacium glaucopus]